MGFETDTAIRAAEAIGSICMSYRWARRLVGRHIEWNLCRIDGQECIASISFDPRPRGSHPTPQYRANMHYLGKESWSLCHNTRQGKGIVERWLARCQLWDGCRIMEA